MTLLALALFAQYHTEPLERARRYHTEPVETEEAPTVTLPEDTSAFSPYYTLDGSIFLHWADVNNGDFDDRSPDRNDFFFGSSRVGLTFLFNERLEAGMSLLFEDVLEGSYFYSTYFPSLSEAYVKLYLPGDKLQLTLGRFSLVYGSGLLVNDLNFGSEGALLTYFVTDKSWVDVFLIRQLENYLFGDLSEDMQTLGVYSHFGDGETYVEPYAASQLARNYYTGEVPRWLGARGEMTVAPLRSLWLSSTSEISALVSGAKTSLSYYSELKGGSGLLTLGVGYFHFAPDIDPSLGYTFVLDNSYNGWSGFGDAMTWAVMPGSVVAPFVSSHSVGDPYGIYWVGVRNLNVLDLVLEANLRGYGRLRFDLFDFSVVDPAPLTGRRIGRELSANYTTSVYELYVGAGLGYLFPGALPRALVGTGDAPTALRLYVYKDFDTSQWY